MKNTFHQWPLYNQNREILYRETSKESKHFTKLSNNNKFNWLMCNENKAVSLQVATFVSKANILNPLKV